MEDGTYDVSPEKAREREHNVLESTLGHLTATVHVNTRFEIEGYSTG